MIDLHAHTTASDGRSTPEQLVRRAAAAGITTLAVTDHDTAAGVAAATAAAQPLGLEIVMGIEITAVVAGRDVHMLGYFFDDTHDELSQFLAAQRLDRRRRVETMIDRLVALGAPVDRAAILKKNAKPGEAIGRPVIARALVAAGHARDIADAFDKYLAEGRPAFVPRQGASPTDVVRLLGRAGGIASFAHPGKIGLDHLLPELAANGLVGVEVFHPDHDEEATAKYLGLASDLGLAPTGGSDFHGPGSGRAECLGTVGMTQDAYRVLRDRVPQ